MTALTILKIGYDTAKKFEGVVGAVGGTLNNSYGQETTIDTFATRVMAA